ncbi:MAG: hypothetical protein ACD_43C00142G0003 [uncultured bacterium]|nr:MAG: hypothetical protein ACD_43C00142G0003 [uncultured bacterium]
MDFLSPAVLGPIVVSIVITVGFLLWQKSRSAEGNKGINNGQSILRQYVTNFSDMAKQGKLDPIIGRQREVDQLVRVLSRKTKNNALLLGEPGVGKTAVVERLAQLIHTGIIPEQLQGKEIIALDLASLVAGTKYRGELEQRLEHVRNELRARAGQVILFIDEIHQLSQARGSEGGLNPADILKPELARGYLQVIGATTYEDYEKYILSDESLERRFQPIHIHEASQEETLNILQGVKPVFEKFHHVTYSADALQAIIELSKKFITKRYLPDKAIDVLDEAGVRARIIAIKNNAVTKNAGSTSTQTNTDNLGAVDVDLVRAVVAEWVDQSIENIK